MLLILHILTSLAHSEAFLHAFIIFLVCVTPFIAFAQTPPNACPSGQYVISQLANTGQACGTVAYGNVTGAPTNVSSFTNDAGYITSSSLTPYATTSALTSGLAAKLSIPTGTSGQFLNGLGAPVSAPAGQVQSNWTEANTGLDDYILNKPPARSFNNTPARTIQTVAAAGNGWQLSTVQDANVSYSVLVTVTASITSGQSGYVVVEICPTNSSTAANWVEVARTSSSQIYTLAIAIQGVQASGVPMEAIVPAGYYVRLRSVNVTGTPTYAFVSGQEVLL